MSIIKTKEKFLVVCDSNSLSVSFSPDDKNLVVGTHNDILIFDSDSFNLLNILEGHSDWIWVLNFSHCG